MKQLAACRCPTCSGVHRVELDAEQTWGIDVDQGARFVIICRWCIRHLGANTLQLLDRERATLVSLN